MQNTYQCRVLGRNRRVVRVETFKAANGIARAIKLMLSPELAHGFELWRGKSRIGVFLPQSRKAAVRTHRAGRAHLMTAPLKTRPAVHAKRRA